MEKVEETIIYERSKDTFFNVSKTNYCKGESSEVHFQLRTPLKIISFTFLNSHPTLIHF